MTLKGAWGAVDKARGTTLPKPATAAAIAKLRAQLRSRGHALPTELAASLAIHDGGIHIDGYDLLPAKRVAAWSDTARLHGDVAFAADGGGNAHFWTDATLIARAVNKDQVAIVKLLLERGCPIDNGSESGGRTALFEACWGKGRPKCFKLLLAKGANPNAMTSYDGTPLHAAVMFGNVELIKALVAKGADPSFRDAKGLSAIDKARKSKSTQGPAMVKALTKGR